MSMKIRKADQRGRADHGWLDTRHTFSFASYYDPAQMGFRTLRVINDDRVKAGYGFGTHPHRDMEIISYVLDGALEHHDSMGHGSIIRPGDVQRMSAGRGVRHSEFNHSKTEPLRFLQIWIEPAVLGTEPGYEQRTFPPSERQGQLRLIASPDGEADSVTLQQDAKLYSTLLTAGEEASHTLSPGRHAWVQVARGQATLNGELLGEGDGVALSNEPEISLRGVDDAEVLLFDLG